MVRLFRLTPLSGRSIQSDNCVQGHEQQYERYEKVFYNDETDEYYKTTDLQQKKNKRKKIFNDFKYTYKNLHKEKNISILSGESNINNYKSVGDFLRFICKKLRRKNIEIYGYVWVRDVGEIKFEPHIHFYIAISRIDGKVFKDLFKNKKHSKYEIQYLRSINGMNRYLLSKELYGGNRKRSYGKSRKFLLPKAS